MERMKHVLCYEDSTEFCILVVCSNGNMSRFEHVRCNPDVAPRLTSGGYEDKVDVFTTSNILFIGGGKF